jgi:hypothetical protein
VKTFDAFERCRERLLDYIHYNENQIFVSDRSSDADLTNELYQRLVGSRIGEVKVYGSGKQNWERAKRLSAEFIKKNADFECSEKLRSGAWIAGICTLTRKKVGERKAKP